MGFTKRIVRLIETSTIYCWTCKKVISLNEIRSIKMHDRKIAYKCSCGNSGYRTFESIKREIIKKGLDYEFSGGEKSIFGTKQDVDHDDFALPFMIVDGQDYWNMYICSSCRHPIAIGRPVYEFGGNRYCQQCYGRNFITCSICAQVTSIYRASTVEGHGPVCQSCYSTRGFTKCQTCGQNFEQSRMKSTEMCIRCHEDLRSMRSSSVAPNVSIIATDENKKILKDKNSEI